MFGWKKFFARPQPNLLPQEKEQQWCAFAFADGHLANPVAGFSKKAANGSPSPGPDSESGFQSEGRGEDGL
jgi:hypothetical protein